MFIKLPSSKSYIQAYSDFCATLASAWHTWNPGIFRTFPSQRFKMEFFAKMVKNYNYISKALHLRPLTSLYILYDIYSEPCLLSKIQTYSNIFTSYSDIISHIVAYLEPCVTLAYSEPCHIQNAGIFRTQVICQGIF